ncbi:MAG TPA: dihydrofolate reductase family protein [Puia sp.]|nr:dihydrofolate reductase family protein [Puia sp.]
MGKIIVGFAVSLDGFIEGPNHEIDWIIHDKDQFKKLKDQWDGTEAMIYGRKTYETVITMAKKRRDLMNPFSHMKHYVFSESLEFVEEGFILTKGNTRDLVEKIKMGHEKNIAVFGGAILASSLINLGLVDELVFAICPVILGSGKPYFSGITGRKDFSLKESVSFSSGLVSLTYSLKPTEQKQLSGE